MKKYAYVLLTFFLITNNLLSYSQGCLPEGIVFTTQQQIDDFQTNYPGCTEIEGDVVISGGDIVNLNGLNGVNLISGDLKIQGSTNLENLEGLDNLRYVDGDFFIGGLNFQLKSLSGLNNLDSIGESLFIINNVMLPDILPLSNIKKIGGHLIINTNDILDNLQGLENITAIPGDVEILSFNLSTFSGLDNLTMIGGELKIAFCWNTQNLEGLENLYSIGGEFKFLFNHIKSISKLENLSYIGGRLWISNNDSLQSLNGLHNINPASITEIHISYNPSLSSCAISSICEFLIEPYGPIQIYENSSGCNSKEEIKEQCPSGINEMGNNNILINIFPNPAKKSITIESKSKIESVTIFDQTGQRILHNDNAG